MSEAKPKRRLVAIMFADIVGYTRLMQEDEVAAKEMRDRHRRILHDSLSEHGGEVIQYYGDGTLSIFSSSIDAVTCAVGIQRASLGSPPIPLRIGIHSGDIIVDHEGAYGDGVNVASRVESLGTAGAVLISDKVHDDIKNQPEFKARSLGEFEFKNVKRPIQVHAMEGGGLTVPNRKELKGKGKGKAKRLAVLPFVNLSADKDNEFFSDGITEELINALGKIDGLQVTSRISSFAFKGKNPPVKVLKKKLDVNSVLQGTVRKSGNRVRISAELVSTIDGVSQWSERYDRDLEDIFEVQDEISASIANQLRSRLSLAEKDTSAVEAQTDNINAYTDYLLGKFHYNKWSVGSTTEAIRYYEKSIEAAPNFAPAYAGLATCYTYFGNTGHLPPKRAAELGEEFALKALAVDTNSAEAHLALSIINFFFRWDWERGEREADTALRLNPGLADGIVMKSFRSLIDGDTKTGLEILKKAHRIDPLSPVVLRTIGDNLYLSGDYDEAIDHYDQALVIDPGFRAATEFKGWALMMKGDPGQAIALFESLGDETTFSVKPFTQLGYAHVLNGDRDKGYHYLRLVQEQAENDPETSYHFDFAILNTALGRFDEAFQHLEKCIEERSGSMVLLNLSPIWRPLRDDPRYHALIDRIGIKLPK